MSSRPRAVSRPMHRISDNPKAAPAFSGAGEGETPSKTKAPKSKKSTDPDSPTATKKPNPPKKSNPNVKVEEAADDDALPAANTPVKRDAKTIARTKKGVARPVKKPKKKPVYDDMTESDEDDAENEELDALELAEQKLEKKTKSPSVGRGKGGKKRTASQALNDEEIHDEAGESGKAGGQPTGKKARVEDADDGGDLA